MVPTFVDSALQDLSWLKNHSRVTDYFKSQIEGVELNLGLLKMFLHCLINVNLSSVVSSLEDLWDNSGERLYAAGISAIFETNFKDWNMLSSKLEEKMQLFEQEINKNGMHLISCSLQYQYFPSDQILEFLDEVLDSLKHMHHPGENQIETLKEKLLLLRYLVDFTVGRCPDVKNLRDFMIHVHTWAHKAASLTCLYWVNDVEDEETGKRLNLWLTDLLQKVNPCTPEFTGICFAVMKSTKSSRADTFIFGEFLSSFVNFLLQNMPVALKDEIEILHEGLIFLISFLADPPASSAEDYPLTLTRSEIDDVLGEASHTICFFDEKEEDLGRNMTILLHFGRKMQYIRGQIEKHYVQIPHFNFPRTNGLGFVEHLLGNIEDLTMMMNDNPKLVLPFAKHQIFRVKEELMSLCQSVQVIQELQNEHRELKDLLVQITNVAYQTEIAVNSSFVIDHPIWYHLTCLSCVLRDIKDVRNKFENFKSNQDYVTGLVASLLPSVYMPSDLGSNGVVVGFNDETQVLIDRITRGTEHLHIVPIVGMGGLGKTTLARKLYNEPSVRCHFIVQAFCNVGQEHRSRNMLLEILKGLIEIDDGIRAMTRDDLAHRLYKCLKGRRYLIIMDDIWDVSAWKGVKDAFPDDNNGSRVVFTTRISSVALSADSDCQPHDLRFFSMDESWELLQAKLFFKDTCPTDLLEVGMLIAKKCNGLPLAVVVIAGVLARIPRSLSSWNRIADDLTPYVSSKGCKEVLEYSYKHLPEALKPCLLYFGAFVNDKHISAKRLMLLWEAEGFVPKSERNHFLSMTKRYLNDLVTRSLVIVDSRSSTGGGIKSCHVHDLIRDLCVTIAQEEQLLHLIKNGSRPLMYEQYRICIQEKYPFVSAKARALTLHTLLYFPISDSTVFSDTQFPYSNFKLLQVLDLQEVYVTEDKFPEEVTMLVHLIYLALAMWDMNYVPPIIAKLRNLETFVLLPGGGVWKVCLPNTIWKMKRLKHVDVGCDAEVQLDEDVNKESSQLPDVESFSTVTIGHGLKGEEILRRLPNARKLSCKFVPSWDGDKRSDRVPKMDHLTMLESLNIVSSGVRYPCVFSFPATLKKLSLSDFYLPWSEFSTLAKLPCLEVLKLSSDAFEGERWDVEKDEFPNLKFLKLDRLDVAEWIVSVDSFPCLERLNVMICRYLMEIPACFAEVPTLETIEVYKCKETAEESAIQIQKEQLEMGNERLQVLITKRLHPW